MRLMPTPEEIFANVDLDPEIASDLGPVDLVVLQELADLLTIVRCPCCRGPLVAQMTSNGPEMTCLCPRQVISSQ